MQLFVCSPPDAHVLVAFGNPTSIGLPDGERATFRGDNARIDISSGFREDRDPTHLFVGMLADCSARLKQSSS